MWNNNNSSTVGVRGERFFFFFQHHAPRQGGDDASTAMKKRAEPLFKLFWLVLSLQEPLFEPEAARRDRQACPLWGGESVAKSQERENERGKSKRSIRKKRRRRRAAGEKEEAELDFFARRLGSIFFFLSFISQPRLFSTLSYIKKHRPDPPRGLPPRRKARERESLWVFRGSFFVFEFLAFSFLHFFFS